MLKDEINKKLKITKKRLQSMRLTRQIIDLGHEIRIKQIINYNFKST
jgi:hypothetical protein